MLRDSRAIIKYVQEIITDVNVAFKVRSLATPEISQLMLGVAGVLRLMLILGNISRSMIEESSYCYLKKLLAIIHRLMLTKTAGEHHQEMSAGKCAEYNWRTPLH